MKMLALILCLLICVNCLGFSINAPLFQGGESLDSGTAVFMGITLSLLTTHMWTFQGVFMPMAVGSYLLTAMAIKINMDENSRIRHSWD